MLPERSRTVPVMEDAGFEPCAEALPGTGAGPFAAEPATCTRSRTTAATINFSCYPGYDDDAPEFTALVQ